MKKATLLYGSSDNPDVLYFSKIFIPDPFVALKVGKKRIAVLGALEYSRVSKADVFDEVLHLEEWGKDGFIPMIQRLAQEYKINTFKVARDFPIGLGLGLKASEVNLEVSHKELFPERIKKSEAEAKAIAQGNRASAAGFKVAETILRNATIKSNKLYYNGKPLNSEFVRSEIGKACLDAGAIPKDTIVAGGNQACDPHCLGSGPLRPHELIIVDIFPRNTKTGYHGDMTRTFLKGQASDAQKQLVSTVRSAQKAAIAKVKSGATGKAIHSEVQRTFDEKGYVTCCKEGVYEGFFHATGHGLGLEVHEAPRVNPSGGALKEGSVITIEPGLYYPGLGGCRIEDVVWVQAQGCKMLSKYHYTWHLK